MQYPDYFCQDYGYTESVPDNNEGYGYHNYDCVCDDRITNCGWERKNSKNANVHISIKLQIGIGVITFLVIFAAVAAVLEWKKKMVNYISFSEFKYFFKFFHYYFFRYFLNYLFSIVSKYFYIC